MKFKIALVVAQESLYNMKCNFGQLGNVYIDFTAVFILRVNIKIFLRLHTLLDVTQ